MDTENKYHVIVAGETGLWSVNPYSKMRLRLKPAKESSKMLDVICSDLGVFHAVELKREESKRVGKYVKTFPINYIQILDSISGGSVLTFYPPGTKDLPLEKRCVKLDFRFDLYEDSLNYTLNGTESILFPHCYTGSNKVDGLITFEGNDVYSNGRKILHLDEQVKSAVGIDAQVFAKEMRIKNPGRYDRNKEYFKF